MRHVRLGDRGGTGDERLGESQALAHRADDLGTALGVAVRDDSAVLSAGRVGFADVVEECGEHEQRTPAFVEGVLVETPNGRRMVNPAFEFAS